MTFQPGKTGNPHGRPRGSRNKATLLAEQLLEGDMQAIVQAAIDKAERGKMSGIALCLTRLLPARKERGLAFDLPPINTPADAVTAMAAIASAVAAGDVTPGEAAGLSKVVEAFADILVAADLAQRITRLEAEGGK